MVTIIGKMRPAGPPPALSADDARAAVLAGIARIEDAVLAPYSPGEQQSWPTQMREAASFRGLTQAELLAGELGTTGADLALAPFLVGTCTAEHGEATDEERLAQVNSLALAVMSNAAGLAQLSQALIGIRRRGYAAIDAAADAAGIRIALDAAVAEVSSVVS